MKWDNFSILVVFFTHQYKGNSNKYSSKNAHPCSHQQIKNSSCYLLQILGWLFSLFTISHDCAFLVCLASQTSSLTWKDKDECALLAGLVSPSSHQISLAIAKQLWEQGAIQHKWRVLDCGGLGALMNHCWQQAGKRQGFTGEFKQLGFTYIVRGQREAPWPVSL